MVKQFADAIAKPGFPEKNREILSNAIDLARVAQKFILPHGGRLYDDPEYRALDENKPLRLPYPLIALEYARGEFRENKDFMNSSKAILFAREENDFIILTPVIWADYRQIWGPMPEAAIPRIGYLDRTVTVGRYKALNIYFGSGTGVDVNDYADEAGALLCFLNVLQCKNVQLERSDPKKAGKKIKTALPFDTYHVLTIDVPDKAGDGASTGGHRSPREHLRRGHIRRLADSRRIWVNATVVAAGRGAGVVTKDYAVRCAA